MQKPSYTFVENLMMGKEVYHNANRILPQFQHPQPGEGMVLDSLLVYDLEPGKWVRVSTWVEAHEAKQEILESVTRYKAAERKTAAKKSAASKARAAARAKAPAAPSRGKA